MPSKSFILDSSIFLTQGRRGAKYAESGGNSRFLWFEVEVLANGLRRKLRTAQTVEDACDRRAEESGNRMAARLGIWRLASEYQEFSDPQVGIFEIGYEEEEVSDLVARGTVA